jgi:hypothetical protein
MHILTYTVVRIDSRGDYTVWENDNGVPVNEYKGYEKGGILKLYPSRKLMPSAVLLEKKQISIQNTKRGF